ncbi:MAG TPA: diadenylate cyclase CdaA [Sedimentisphaerales bacterium]|nr:diadenylate cyclase CdaA [Sedimentisphaerales bacterium]
MDAIFDYLRRVLTYPHIEVLVELALIGFVVYWFVNFLEGTRGERLFRGVIFIVVTGSLILSFLVRHYGFERLQFLYSRFLIAVLILAVAAFQPEIRRALIRIGQPRLVWSASHQLSRTIEEIVTAAADFSSSRTGAIVVIERQVALGEFISGGVMIDAQVTSELLRTIFYPGTPLHDMAVVIRGERMIAARVQLPLAETGAHDKIDLGSRHRAAIGISAGSDAIVVVVSEETGIISMAENGSLTRNINDSDLRNRLTQVMTEPSLLEKFRKIQKKRLSSEVVSS